MNGDTTTEVVFCWIKLKCSCVGRGGYDLDTRVHPCTLMLIIVQPI